VIGLICESVVAVLGVVLIVGFVLFIRRYDSGRIA
jgi:hypothetical protein